MKTFTKTPAEKAWYGFDFARDGWLADLGDGIVIDTGDNGPVWDITALSSADDDTPLTGETQDLTADSTTPAIYLEGGTAGRNYRVSVVAKATDDPQTIAERSFVIRVRSTR